MAAGLSSLTIGYAVEAGGWGAWSMTLLPAAVLGAASSLCVHACMSGVKDDIDDNAFKTVGRDVLNVPDEAQLQVAGEPSGNKLN